MSKKSRKRKPRQRNRIDPTVKPESKFKITRRTLIRWGFAVAILVPGYVAVSAYIEKQEIRYDLSVIGQGKPVLVQVHDPNCPKCRKLLSSVEAVIDNFPELEFRIANIKSVKGNNFAFNHSVPYISLVFLGSEGEQIETSTGLQSKDQVIRFIESGIKADTYE